ncbi:MAG TPA: lamin tail domain-containing protein [Polyangia bacterium]|nr:lamin tail domain-containing protein [Polyangia bacterium]
MAACVPSVPHGGARPVDESAADAAPATEAPPFPASSTSVPRADAASVGPFDAGGVTSTHAEAGSDAARDAANDVAADAAPEAPRARAPRAGEISIDELLVDPAGDDLGHEWIEIANVAAEPLDLATLHVSDGTTDVAIDAGVLPAGALLVLGQSAERAHNGDAPVDLAYGTRLSLNNGGDRVAVCLGACASGLTLDAVAWTAPWGADYVGHAVIVAPGATCPAEEPYGADGNFGSPGRANPPCPRAPAEPADAAAVDGRSTTDAPALDARG